tara:strand:- start:15522 stop:15728 length:207 start_codon:yes stop_codon:yes gene_type:complete
MGIKTKIKYLYPCYDQEVISKMRMALDAVFNSDVVDDRVKLMVIDAIRSHVMDQLRSASNSTIDTTRN